MRTQSFASADAQGRTSLATPFSKHKNPLVLFSAPLKPKMQMEEEARSMWRTWPYPSPLLQRRGELLPAPTAREGCGLQAGWEGAEHFGKPCCHFLLSFQGQMFLVMASDTGKESILVASLMTQAPLLGNIWLEVLPASIVFHRMMCHRVFKALWCIIPSGAHQNQAN